MTLPLITVAIPAYNHAPFIAEAIESALSQKGVEVEVVIVDDASTDKTAIIAESFAARDNRVRVIRNHHNLGPSFATQVYLQHARGKYICTLASDDVFVPDKLLKQLAIIESNENLALVATGVAFIDESSMPIEHRRHFAASLFDITPRDRASWLRYFFNVGNCICASGVLVRADLFQKFIPDTRLVQLQDYDCWVRMVLAGYDIEVIPEPLVRYRIHKQHANLSAPSYKVHARNLFEHIKVLDRFTALSSLGDLAAIEAQGTRKIPEGVCEKIYVQHRLLLHAWSLGLPQHRYFALENWYRMLGTQAWLDDLKNIGVNARFLAEKTAKNPLAEAEAKTMRRKLIQMIEYLAPASFRNTLAKHIKMSRGGN